MASDEGFEKRLRVSLTSERRNTRRDRLSKTVDWIEEVGEAEDLRKR